MHKTKSYAAFDPKSPLKFYEFNRRKLNSDDVLIDIDYCGVCHSDLHEVRSEWSNTTYPFVPGHEIIGRVKEIGSSVTKFKIGDLVGVGCMVNSCGKCEPCEGDTEQFCQKGASFTYNSPDPDNITTKGGYSDKIVVNNDFVLKIPENLDPAAAAPLLCAGITTYSPLKYWNIKANDKVGIVGLGGLGHMGVKIAKSMGAHVIVFSRTENKKADALKLGADEVVISTNNDEMQKVTGTLDFILDTVSAPHDVAGLLQLLKIKGNLCMVGASPEPHKIPSSVLIFGQKNLCGSLIGGIAETQEMLDYCGKHNITSDIEMISIQNINEAYERMLKSDVKYRFVIDIKSLTK